MWIPDDGIEGRDTGDLMFFPATDMSREEILHRLRYLKPTSSFRNKFDYDNLLYMVAGQLRISGNPIDRWMVALTAAPTSLPL